MEPYNSAFSRLSPHLRDSILRDVFKQLDQLHHSGVVTLVCRLWHRLALDISSSITVTITREDADDDLRRWLGRHGQGLESFNLAAGFSEGTGAAVAAAEVAADALTLAPNLRSLTVILTTRLQDVEELDLNLAPCTHLTSLGLTGWPLSDSTLSSMLSLRQLKSLDFSSTLFAKESQAEQFMQNMSTSLVQLTSLNLSHADVNFTFLPAQVFVPWMSAICCLPALQKLESRGPAMPCNVADLARLPGPVPPTWLEVLVHGQTCKSHIADWVRRSGQKLEGLRIDGHWLPQAVGLHVLCCAPNLCSLSLSSIDVNLKELAVLTQLTSVELTVCEISDTDLRQLPVLPNLRNLDLSWNRDLRDEHGSMRVLEASV